MSGERRAPALLERPVPREQFRKELRARLMSEAVVVLAPRSSTAPFFLRFRPALAAAAAVVLVLAGATSASASSLPGDPLYVVKRAGEDVRLALTFDDFARMQLLSEFVDRRLEELAEIAHQRPTSAPTATAQYAEAVERFADAVDRLRDAESDEKRDAAQSVADAAREKHRLVVDTVREKLPEEARPELQRVIENEEERTKPSEDTNRGSRRGNQTAKPTPKR
ncbi:MAG TPA: DUF5667 domain-containing protein [Candidatus Limnocylindria bacterium]|jgi:hypothetical protein|nr:DUF5667 domain-containing protein [Candidatus Limnocylindria bacterium]